MRILYTTLIFPNTDGTSILVQGLSESLSKLGNSSIILTSDIKTNLSIESTSNYKITKIPYFASDFIFGFLKIKESNLFRKFIGKKINLIEDWIILYLRKFALKHSLTLLWGVLYDRFGWKLLIKILLLNTRKIDLIYTTPIGQSCVVASLVAARIKKLPIAITPAYHFMLELYTSYDKQWGEILSKFNLIMPHTKTELKYLSKIGVPSNLQIPIGVGVPFNQITSAGNGNWKKRLNIPENGFLVLYINNSIADKLKGIDIVIRSAIELPSVYFLFVGRFKHQWQNLVNEHRIEGFKNIRYYEFVTNEEKFQLLNAVDLIVKPSVNDSFGIVFFEGMCAGKPIITYNIPIMKEISRNVGFMILNHKELTEKIYILKNNKDLYMKFSENAKSKAQKYAWESLARKFSKLFQNLV